MFYVSSLAQGQVLPSSNRLPEYEGVNSFFETIDSLSRLTTNPLPFEDSNNWFSIGFLPLYENEMDIEVRGYNQGGTFVNISRLENEIPIILGMAHYKQSPVILYHRLLISEKQPLSYSMIQEQRGQINRLVCETGRVAGPLSATIRFIKNKEAFTKPIVYADFMKEENRLLIAHYMSPSDCPRAPTIEYNKTIKTSGSRSIQFMCNEYAFRDSLFPIRVQEMLQPTLLLRNLGYINNSHSYSITTLESGEDLIWNKMVSDELEYHYKDALSLSKKIYGIAYNNGNRYLLMGAINDELFVKKGQETSVEIKLLPEDELEESVCVDTSVTIRFSSQEIKIHFLL